MRNGSFSSGTFRKILLSYTAILMIPIIVFSALNVQRNIIEEKRRQHEEQAMDAKRIADLVDNKLGELKNLGKTLSNESWVKKLMQHTSVYDQEFDITKMLEIRKSLDNSVNSQGILSFGMVVFPEQQQALTSWGMFPLQELFQSIAAFDEPARQQLLGSFSEQQYFTLLPPAGMKLWGSDKRVIPVLQSLEVVNHPRAVLVLFMDSAYLTDYMHRFGGTGLQEIAMTSRDALIYRQTRNDPPGSSAATFPIHLSSQASDLQYTISYVDSSVIGIGNLFSSLAAILISIILGACSAYLLARISYRPLGALLNKLSAAARTEDSRQGSVRGSEYNYIEKSFDRLLHENRKLQQSMQDYESAAKSNLYLRLLKGYFIDDHHKNELGKLGIDYTEEMYYCTMLVSFHAIRDFSDFEKIRKIEMLLMMIVEQAMSRYGLDYELFEVTNADKAMIVSSARPFGDDDMLERMAAGMAGEIERLCGFHPDILYGGVEQGLVGISKSYYTANERLHYTVFSREHFQVLQEETIQAGVDYYYPTDWEVQLINNLKIGNLDTSLQILHEIHAENERRELMESSVSRLLSLLMETMLRVLHELNLDTAIYSKQFSSRAKAADTQEMWSYMFEVGTLICERKRYANTSSAMTAGSELLQYVNHNYASADISLKQLAEMYQMSVSKVSKIFKEVTGINFYDYVCRLRMEKAKELLRERSCGIDHVAHRVGYENVYSFKRAFARYEGIKPDEYAGTADGR